MSYLIRECIACGKVFKGGPRAWYCPECREIRQKKTNAEYRERKRAGTARAIGSIDICQNCGAEYKVCSGLQKYCPDCQEEMHRQLDARQSLEYYQENKESINPARNTRRRCLPRACAVCGRNFEAHGQKKYCSPACAEAAKEPLKDVYEKRRSLNACDNSVEELRKEKGYTITELSELSGVSFVTISCIEKKKRNLTKKTAEKIAAALGVEPDELFR